MYKKMVVLLDGSELAEVVFHYAQELSGRLHIDVDLLHICRPQAVAQLPMCRAYVEQKAEELCTKAEEVRARYSKDAVQQCVVARGNVAVGYPAEEILKYIDDNDIDLVMMSTHGSSGVKTWDLGEVANKVIHASRIPVWLVPTALREEIIADNLPARSLVVPLSGSKESSAAIPHAVSLITHRGEGELVLLHVVEMPTMSVTRETSEDVKRQRGEMKEYLEKLAQPIRESGVEVRTVVLVGSPAAQIINYLKANPTQLLAMATSRKGRLSRMVFGNVTENIIHMVKVTPLLLVNGED